MDEWKELKQIERQLILYDIFLCNDEDTRISTIRRHLPGINIRTLQRDIKDLMDAGLISVYFSRDKNAYINYGRNIDFRYYSEGIQKRIEAKRNAPKTDNHISPRKREHLERLKRLAKLMTSGEIYQGADKVYFEMFPEATERMRQRDFETLRHIGYIAGYNKYDDTYELYQDEDYGFWGDYRYGIYSVEGKLKY